MVKYSNNARYGWCYSIVANYWAWCLKYWIIISYLTTCYKLYVQLYHKPLNDLFANRGRHRNITLHRGR